MCIDMKWYKKSAENKKASTNPSTHSVYSNDQIKVTQPKMKLKFFKLAEPRLDIVSWDYQQVNWLDSLKAGTIMTKYTFPMPFVLATSQTFSLVIWHFSAIWSQR